jgi:hypothetical protein
MCAWLAPTREKPGAIVDTVGSCQADSASVMRLAGFLQGAWFADAWLRNRAGTKVPAARATLAKYHRRHHLII